MGDVQHKPPPDRLFIFSLVNFSKTLPISSIFEEFVHLPPLM